MSASDNWNSPSWKKAGEDYHASRKTVGPQARFAPRQEALATPGSIVDALIYCIKSRGVDALKEPGNVGWLAQCDEQAKARINKFVAKISGGAQ